MTLQRFILFVSFTMFSFNVRASGHAGDDFDWANALAILFIISCVSGAIWLARYVKRQQRNNVLPMIWMNNSLLKGRLLNMVVLLERADAISVDAELCVLNDCHVSVIMILERHHDILDLIKQTDLGKWKVNKIIKGFDCLNQALACYENISVLHTVNMNEKNADILKYKSLILSAVRLFEAVIPDIYE
ncbi:hypothetical protein [Oxalobacter formigenes]|uniref:hypothetical protein n=1 Tax=Oxalobacter formigenes TaxID=847 RepID=UPI00241D5CB6|nr:hypothetical protein [Oxalobacter formigenes]